MKNCFQLFLFLGVLSMTGQIMAQEEANYDEAKVLPYALPDVLTMQDGSSVGSPEQWWQARRPELLGLFETQVYGRAPGRPEGLGWTVFEQSDDAYGGLAERKQVRIQFSSTDDEPGMDLLIYLPRGASQPVPLFLGLNFSGNQSITDDPDVRISTSWMRDVNDNSVVEHRATESSRGQSKSRWPIEQILARGYGLAVAYYGDIDPDFDDGFRNGVHALYHADAPPGPDEWGSISAWAWGLSRALDYLTDDPQVDAQRVAVVGHSRLGKTALWAGARDQRFAVVISNNSGCGGAALNRRRFGETVRRINTSFPHWFCDNFVQYNDQEDQLPLDQHSLVALAAPRPVLICSAEDDRWADPRGEFLAGRNAAGVYRLLGLTGLEQDEMPAVNQLVGDRVGYHVRPGQHDMTPADWEVYMDFCDRFLQTRQP
jgi:hypothetical protein